MNLSALGGGSHRPPEPVSPFTPHHHFQSEDTLGEGWGHLLQNLLHGTQLSAGGVAQW
jgi:hypothetical protein